MNTNRHHRERSLWFIFVAVIVAAAGLLTVDRLQAATSDERADRSPGAPITVTPAPPPPAVPVPEPPAAVFEPVVANETPVGQAFVPEPVAVPMPPAYQTAAPDTVPAPVSPYYTPDDLARETAREGSLIRVALMFALIGIISLLWLLRIKLPVLIEKWAMLPWPDPAPHGNR